MSSIQFHLLSPLLGTFDLHLLSLLSLGKEHWMSRVSQTYARSWTLLAVSISGMRTAFTCTSMFQNLRTLQSHFLFYSGSLEEGL